ncbi:MAG: response regulator transcription factor [Christensenellaceae bacterium]|nr:response regulator transcription factor [Christensenellaceae bacterium]
MKTVLLVEDERDVLENNRKFFAAEGYRVLTAENLTQAREHLRAEAPGAIVLDIMLPDGNGLDLLSELRAAGSKTPIIMLTAWGKSSDVARGLKLGANDYMSKPFTYEVLQARVEAMFRNVEQVPETVTRGLLTLKLTSREAFVNGADLLLTAKEYTLLQFFVQNENRAMSAEYVYESVWGQPMAGDSQALITAVSRLRKKMTGCGYTISSEYGNGYCFGRGEP